ncbi:hypothetical protein MJD09_11620 [bacterium]|nr:hypothetical protein [bacterium]
MRRQIEIRCSELSRGSGNRPMMVIAVSGSDLREVAYKANWFCRSLASEEPKGLVLWNFEDSIQQNAVWPDAGHEPRQFGSTNRNPRPQEFTIGNRPLDLVPYQIGG